jgi:hypothetical protein
MVTEASMSSFTFLSAREDGNFVGSLDIRDFLLILVVVHQSCLTEKGGGEMRNRFLVLLGIELFVAFLVVGGLSLFFLYPEFAARAEGALREEGRSRARSIAASVADRCTEPMLDDDEFVLGLVVAKTAEKNGEINWIGVVGAEGETIAHTDKELTKRRIVLPAGIQPVRDGDFVSGFYGSELNSLWASYPIVVRGARMGTVHMSMTIEPDGIGRSLVGLRTKALFIYLGLGAVCTCIVLLLSFRSIGSIVWAGQRSGGYPGRAQKGSEEEAARQRKEETEISERISTMKKKEKEMITRLRILKQQAATHEKSGRIETGPRFAPSDATPPSLAAPGQPTTPGAPGRRVPEKEKIEAIRRRIHELEERIRGE